MKYLGAVLGSLVLIAVLSTVTFVSLAGCTVDVKVPPPTITVDCLMLVAGQARAEFCEAGAGAGSEASDDAGID